MQVSVVATSLLGNPRIYFIGKQQICLRNKEAVTLRWSYSPDVRKYPLLHHRPVGNPNCGKTSVFNQLTDARQRTGNMAGVTVTSRGGQRERKGVDFHFVDLPGTFFA